MSHTDRQATASYLAAHDDNLKLDAANAAAIAMAKAFANQCEAAAASEAIRGFDSVNEAHAQSDAASALATAYEASDAHRATTGFDSTAANTDVTAWLVQTAALLGNAAEKATAARVKPSEDSAKASALTNLSVTTNSDQKTTEDTQFAPPSLR